MIIGEKAISETVIDAMRQSEFRFYLTGSKYFGTANTSSDTDFFAQDSYGLKQWLFEHGFIEQSTAYNGDNFLLSVLHNAQYNVHVQLYHSDWVHVKDMAQRFIKEHMSKDTIRDKAKMVDIWNLAMLLCKAYKQNDLR